MKNLFFAVTVFMASSFVYANSKTQNDVCDFKTSGWSQMRDILIQVSGLKNSNLATVARRALSGSKAIIIGNFQIQYASGAKAGTNVCYPQSVEFEYTDIKGETTYNCSFKLSVDGKISDITCQGIAG